jgi:hypothetical protein
LADIGLWSIGVDSAFLNKKFMDCLSIAKNNNIGGSEFETEDWAVLSGPLSKPGFPRQLTSISKSTGYVLCYYILLIKTSARNLMSVSQYRYGGRAGWHPGVSLANL